MNNLTNKQLCDLISTVTMAASEGVFSRKYFDQFLEDNDIVISEDADTCISPDVYDHIIDVLNAMSIKW